MKACACYVRSSSYLLPVEIACGSYVLLFVGSCLAIWENAGALVVTKLTAMVRFAFYMYGPVHACARGKEDGEKQWEFASEQLMNGWIGLIDDEVVINDVQQVLVHSI